MAEVCDFEVGHDCQELELFDVVVVEVDLADALEGLLEFLQLGLVEGGAVVDLIVDELVLHEEHLYLAAAQLLQDVLVVHLLELVADRVLLQENAQHAGLSDVVDLLLDDPHLQELIALEDVLVVARYLHRLLFLLHLLALGLRSIAFAVLLLLFFLLLLVLSIAASF